MRRGYFSPSIFILAAITFFVIIAFFLNAYFAKTATKQPPPTISPSPISQTQSSPSATDETANWKTYTNNEFKFSFKYPLDPFCPTGPIFIDQNWAGVASGFTVINLKNKFCEDRTMAITITRKNLQESDLKIGSEWKKLDTSIGSREIHAVKYVRSTIDAIDVLWFFKDDHYGFVVTYSSGGALDQSTADQILSTFRFE